MHLREFLAALSLISFGTQSAWAYCPPLDYSVDAEFGRSDIVALVRAENVTWLDEDRRPVKLKKPLALGNMPDGLDPYIGAYYSVRLVRAFKGHVPRRFRIFSENTTARTPLQMGPTLLLFLTHTKVADEYSHIGDLTADNCGNSSLASTVPNKISRVSRLAAQR